jgi:hypothetical protein
MQTYDKLWKGIIEDMFFYFIKMTQPKLAAKIDWSHEPEFLDQELSQIFPEAEKNNRYIDKLVKVRLTNGQSEMIVIHIEIQGYEDNTFEFRMFTYFYRIFDRYQLPVTALAILTDGNSDYRPTKYNYRCFDTKLSYSFPTFKIMDYCEEDLLQSDNPFALVILATQTALKKGKLDDTRLREIKWNLVRLLLERNYERSVIISLFEFVNNYIQFKKKEHYKLFSNQFYSILNPEQKSMGVVEIIVEDRVAERLAELKVEIEAKGKAEGKILQTISVVTKILSAFPTWEDEKIADLVTTTVDVVANIRASLPKA